VTILYRSAPSESPRFGRGTFWTMHRDKADWLSQVEAETPNVPAHPLYEADVVMRDDLGEQQVDDVLPFLEGVPMGEALPRLRDTLLERGERSAADGYRWVQYIRLDRSWRGAMLYLGDDPIPAQLLPEA
jgi:hypothetical protein